MHPEIFAPSQNDVFPLLAKIGKSYYLAGGTAIALQIGHRQSIDFDCFTDSAIHHDQVRRLFRESYGIDQVLVDEPTELTFLSHGVKLTFLQYPFAVDHPVILHNGISTPDILTLSALKAYALGRRSKWKDYVDLYFILQRHTLHEVVTKSLHIFKDEFDEKLFRSQLSYFDDIDYTEQVIYMPGHEVPDATIKSALQKISLS
ncbi:MAG: nucleotidyl transferase AbiEii/AbiGii toxin family protein [bacterium]